MQRITLEELQKFGKTFSLSKQAIALVNQQKATWELAAANYRSLRQVYTRSFDFNHFRIDCQFNPGRIRSTAANTAAEAIQTRPCFLCAENRPPEQVGIEAEKECTILCNPFPIFPYHLTIVSEAHTPQQLTGRVPLLLKLCYDLQEFTLFYNGARCGASAPDHFHFQAGVKNILPVEEEIGYLLKHQSDSLIELPEIKIRAVENFLRRVLCFESAQPEALVFWLEKTLQLLQKPGETEEPMLNLLGSYENGSWRILLFPRSAQRPWQYFAEGEEKLLVSPAAVELGGLVILPREEDFSRITADDLTDIFGQVTLPSADFDQLKQALRETTKTSEK